MPVEISQVFTTPAESLEIAILSFVCRLTDSILAEVGRVGCELVVTRCQGVTPSNSKGGLPALEARACAQEGGVESQVDSAPSRLKSSQDKAESREEREPGGPTEKEAEVGVNP